MHMPKEDSKILKGIKYLSAKTGQMAKIASTKQCRKCKKEISIRQVICPECKAKVMGIPLILLSGIALSFSAIFCLMGFFVDPMLWIASIISLAVFIAANKFQSKLPKLP